MQPPTSHRLHRERRKVVDLLVAKRLLRTEGEKEQATVSLSHERLFDAWPALKNYVEKNKRQLIDRTLLESRVKRWADKGRPWFEGLASRRECRDFHHAGGTANGIINDYLYASHRAWWVKVATIVLIILGIGGPLAWLERHGVTLKYAGSIVMARMHLVLVVEPEIVTVSGGNYQQGDIRGLGSEDEQPVRQVTIKPFAIGKYEVTFQEYDRYVELTGGRSPGGEPGGREQHPVIFVSWNDAVTYATWLSQATGKRYRLPTESEWEYAARSGGKDEIWAGTSKEEELKNYAVNGADRAEPVGEPRKPNDLGLYDMSGNVCEWVEDCWHGNYQKAPTDGSAWLEQNEGDCGLRVMRGGFWYSVLGTLRASNRSMGYAVFRGDDIGFRLVQDLGP